MWIANKLFPCLALTVVACTALAPARADCPDQSTVDIPGAMLPHGPWQYCPITFTIQDVPIEVFWIPCPAYRVHRPAFGLCHDSPRGGTYCHHEKDLPVELELCHCAPTLPLSPLVSVSTCDCDRPMTIALVQDFSTAPCQP